MQALSIQFFMISSSASGMSSSVRRQPFLADIREHGIKLIGGGSQLKGLDILISRITGFRAYVVERPNYINAVGAGKSLDYIDEFRDSLQDLH